MLKYGFVVAVTVAVTRAVNMAIRFIPVIIQKKEKRRPGMDFGDLSPYLLKLCLRKILVNDIFKWKDYNSQA